MRIFPRNIVLGTAAAVLGFLAFTAEPGGPPARVVGPLLDDFDATAVREVQLRGPDGAEAILRREEGGPWSVANLHGAPAAGDVVEGVLRRLGSVTDLDLLTDDDATEAEISRAYGLGGDEALRITVRGAGGEALADVYVARAPGGGAAAFVREADSRRVVRTPVFNSALPADPALWFLRSPLVNETGFEIQRLALSGPALGEALEIVRTVSAEYETPGGVSLPEPEVKELLEQLRVLPSGVVGPAPAAAPGSAPLEISVTPLTRPPYRISVLETGDPEDREGAPARALRSDQPVVLSIDPKRVARVLEIARAIRAAADGE